MFSIIRRKDSLMLNLIVINDSYIISIYEFIINYSYFFIIYLLFLIYYILLHYDVGALWCWCIIIFSLFLLILFYSFLSFISYYPELSYSIFLPFAIIWWLIFNSFYTTFNILILQLFPLSLFSILYSKSAQFIYHYKFRCYIYYFIYIKNLYLLFLDYILFLFQHYLIYTIHYILPF